jgi:hypothetical protein
VVSACSSPLYSDTFEAIPNDSRTINTIAQKIADTDRLLQSGPHYDFAARELIYSAVYLNSLKDTLEDIEFYKHEVWQELDMTYEILIKAINIKSRVASVARRCIDGDLGLAPGWQCVHCCHYNIPGIMV